jgi:hypothetical protein
LSPRSERGDSADTKSRYASTRTSRPNLKKSQSVSSKPFNDLVKGMNGYKMPKGELGRMKIRDVSSF